MSDLQGLRVVGPLAGFMPGFADALAEAGYVPVSARIQLELAAHVSRWMAERGLGVDALSEAGAVEYLAFRRAGGYTYGKSLKAMTPLLDYLRSIGVAPPAPSAAVLSGPEALLGRYLKYLLGERAMTQASARGYVDLVRPLVVEHWRQETAGLGVLDSAGVTGFVVTQSRRVSPKTAQRMTSALRSLLRYLAVQGLVDPGLIAAVPAVARRQAPLPRPLTPDEASALLDSCDRASVNGRRDYAVLVLLSRLALRSGEVAALRLDDLDWRRGEVVIAGKGARLDRLPVPVDVGLALAAYLRGGRPAGGADRRVFLRVKAPHCGLTSGGITQIVAAAGARAGLGVVHAHRLRHCAATGMLRGGADLAAIGQVLRHRRAATTAIYARVDLPALRALARPWPGSAA